MAIVREITSAPRPASAPPSGAAAVQIKDGGRFSAVAGSRGGHCDGQLNGITAYRSYWLLFLRKTIFVC